jgi:hypothetical protein
LVGFPGIDNERMASAAIFGGEADPSVAPGASAACRATGSGGGQTMLPKTASALAARRPLDRRS